MGANTWQDIIFSVIRSKNYLINVKVSLKLVNHGVCKRNKILVTSNGDFIEVENVKKKCQILKKGV